VPKINSEAKAVSKRSKSRKEELYRQMEGIAAAKAAKASPPIKRHKSLRAIAAILTGIAAVIVVIWVRF
jgi:hypothetical protein